MTVPEIGIARFVAAFRTSFKHAASTKDRTDNVIVWLGTPGAVDCGYGEACPRPYVTGETLESVRRFVETRAVEIVSAADSVAGLREWIAANPEDIDANPAAFAAIEGAILDRMGRRLGVPLERLVDRRALDNNLAYSAILGDSRPLKFTAQAAAYRLFGLTDIKVKLCEDPERDRWKFRCLERIFPAGTALRGDANNLWHTVSEATSHLSFASPHLWAVEEPLEPHDIEGLRAVSDAMDIRIVLDESLTTSKDLQRVQYDPGRWIVNIRVSKVGGMLRAIDLATQAGKMGLDVIVGAHVGETSLLSRAAIAVASSLPIPPIAMEGAFGTRLLTRDLSKRSIMFGRRGRLGVSERIGLEGPGTGLQVHHKSLQPLPERHC